MFASNAPSPFLPEPVVQSDVRITLHPPGERRVCGSLIRLASEDLLLITPTQFSPQTMLELHLCAPRAGLETTEHGIVHWSCEEQGQILCGVFLEEPLPQEWLNQFWDDRRKDLRFNGQWLVGAWTEKSDERLDVLVTDYSRNGAQFLTRHRRTRGEVVFLGSPDNVVRGEVRWCNQADDDCYRVGCELEHDAGIRLSSILRLNSFDL